MEQKTPKSLYDASVGEIATKHFFAGFMQALGGFFVTLLSWVILYYLIMKVFLPQISGIMDQASGLIKSVEKIQNGSSNLMVPSGNTNSNSGSKGIVIPPELIQQFQQAQPKAQ